ncbi:MAG: hypothetical protein LUI05_03050 [Oscillospiraceae bacterium]|nr:hypothetical protein [Oscillospiraceae bacterium]
MESSFFPSRSHDRLYSAADFAGYFSNFIGNGVYANPAKGMQAVANGDMDVIITAGKCYINGYTGTTDGSEVLTLSTGGEYGRYDLIVARLDLTSTARDIHLEVIEGEELETPVYPSYVRDDEQYDLVLAAVMVAANASEVSDADITDLRPYSDYCGWVSHVIGSVDTTDLFRQYQAAWDSLILQLGESDNITINTSDGTARALIFNRTLAGAYGNNYNLV